MRNKYAGYTLWGVVSHGRVVGVKLTEGEARRCLEFHRRGGKNDDVVMCKGVRAIQRACHKNHVPLACSLYKAIEYGTSAIID